MISRTAAGHRRKTLIIFALVSVVLIASAIGGWFWFTRPLAEGNLKFFRGNLYLKARDGAAYLLIVKTTRQLPVPYTGDEWGTWYVRGKEGDQFLLSDGGPVANTFRILDLDKPDNETVTVGPSARFAVYGEFVARPESIGGLADFEDFKKPKTISVKRLELKAK